MQPQDPEPGSSEHEAETRSNIVVMQDRQSCVQKELRRRPARGETHVLTFSLEGLAYHTDAWVVRLCFRVLGGLPYETDRYIGLFAWVFTLLEYVNLVV